MCVSEHMQLHVTTRFLCSSGVGASMCAYDSMCVLS